MKVLVTGGLGFIGSTLSEAYIARGDHVTIVDNQSSNVIGPGAIQGAKKIRCDAKTYAHAGWWHPNRYDLVVHCASPVGPAGILKYKGRIASMILASTDALITLCLAHDTPLINISTSEVYGTSGTYHESDALRVPAVPSARIEYAIGKMAAEAECRLTPGLRSISIRPFNIAGARQSSAGGFVLPTFAEQALAGTPITIYGDGTQQRALTSVDDLADFVLNHTTDYMDGRAVNVGNPHNTTTIADLASLVHEAAQSTSTILHTDGQTIHGQDYHEAEGHIKVPCIDLAQSMGWAPRTTLTTLVDQAVAHTAARIAA